VLEHPLVARDLGGLATIPCRACVNVLCGVSCVAVGVWRCIYVTVLGPSPAEGVCVWSGGVARWDDIPIRAVYNASQDDGYLELVVVPMMLRAGCGVRVCVACVRG
jgi:hypothetical protein